MLVLLMSMACTPPIVEDETQQEEEQEEQVEEALQCEYVGCDELCIEVGEEWACTDTAAPFEICYDQGYQLCEAQSDGTCGWTMLDQAGWDACVDGA